MPFLTSPCDGAQLHYVDYVPASSPPPFLPSSNKPAKDLSGNNITLFFIHGWPMSSQMYENLILKLCEEYRIRCIASDRRGFGKSQWNGKPGDITYDTFAADTIGLLQHLEIGNFIFVATSMGAGESLLAYLKMNAELKCKCKGFIWLAPSLPFPLKTEQNPIAPSRELWNMVLQGFRDDRVGFTKASIGGVFGTQHGIDVAPTVLEKFVNIVNEADALAVERCVGIITDRDFTEDLKKLDGEVKLLVIHGIVIRVGYMPAESSAALIPEYVQQAELKIYQKAAHGVYLTHAEHVVDDLADFVSVLTA